MELSQYLHAACFSLVRSTFEKAMQMNHFKTRPGLTTNILKDLSTSVATVQGHIHQERKNLQNKTKPALTRELNIDTLQKKLDILESKQKPGQTLADTLQSELDGYSFPPSPTPNSK